MKEKANKNKYEAEEKEAETSASADSYAETSGQEETRVHLKPRRLDASAIKRRRIAEAHENITAPPLRSEDEAETEPPESVVSPAAAAAKTESSPAATRKSEAKASSRESSTAEAGENAAAEDKGSALETSESETSDAVTSEPDGGTSEPEAETSEADAAQNEAEAPETEISENDTAETESDTAPDSESEGSETENAELEDSELEDAEAEEAESESEAAEPREAKTAAKKPLKDPGPRPIVMPLWQRLRAKRRRKKRLKKEKQSSSDGLLQVFRQSLAREFKPEETVADSLEKRRRLMFHLWRQRGAAGTLLLLHALLTILLMIIWAVLPRHVFGIDKLAIDGAMFSTLLIQGFAVLLPSAFVMILYNMDIAQVMGHKKQPPAVYGLSALLGIPAAVAFTGLNNISLYVASSLGFSPVGKNILAQSANPSVFSYLLMILATALVPALSEELMFRGIIQSSLALSGRRNLSIFLMATAFALYHNDPYFIIAPLCAGIYLGYLRDKTDNLYTGILMHFVMNASLVLLHPVLPIFTSSMAFAGTAGKTALYASLIAAAVSLVLMIPLSSSLSSLCEAEGSRKTGRRLVQEQWFPADWKFLLGLFILFITMLVLNAV